MKIKSILLLTLFSIIYSSNAQEASKSHTAICVVEPMKIINDLSEWNDCREEIRKDFEQNAAEIKTMEETLLKKATDLQNMGSAVKESTKDTKREELLSLRNDIELKKQLAQEHVSRAQQEAEMKVLASVANTSKKVAQDNKLDLVLANVAHASERVDISEPFKNEMNKEYTNRKNKTTNKEAAPLKQQINFTPKIRVIDPIAIVNQLEERHAIEASIKKEVESKIKQIKSLEESMQKEMMDLQANAATLKNDVKEKKREKILSLRNEIELKQQTTQELFDRLQQEAELKILNTIAQAANEYARPHNIDIVLANTIYASDRVVISSEFIDTINAKYQKETKKADQETTKKEKADEEFEVIVRTIEPFKIINRLDEVKDQAVDIKKELEDRMNGINKLKETFQKKSEELQSMGSAVKTTVKETKREELITMRNEIETKEKMLQDYAQRLQQDAEKKIFEKLTQTAKVIAEKLSIDIIVANVVYASEKIDISDEFITYLNNEYRKKKEPSKPQLKQAISEKK